MAGLGCSHDKVKVCGMGAGNDMAILISNYSGLVPGTEVTVRTPAAALTPVWDLHSTRPAGTTDREGAFTVALDGAAAHLYYLGSKYAAAVPRR